MYMHMSGDTYISMADPIHTFQWVIQLNIRRKKKIRGNYIVITLFSMELFREKIKEFPKRKL